MSLWKKILGLSWKFCLVVLGLYGLLKLFRETRLFALNIPDWIFFIWAIFLSIILVITIDYVNKNRGTPADDTGLVKEIEGLKKNLENSKKEVNRLEAELRGKLNAQGQIIAQIYNDPKQYRKLEPNDEILFILETLASRSRQSVVWRDLQLYYLRNFDKVKTQADFNITVNQLVTNGYVWLNENAEPEEYEITPKGLDYFALIRKKE